MVVLYIICILHFGGFFFSDCVHACVCKLGWACRSVTYMDRGQFLRRGSFLPPRALELIQVFWLVGQALSPPESFAGYCINLKYIYLFCAYICVYVPLPQCFHGGYRKTTCHSWFLLLIHGLQESNSSCQAWQQVCLLTEVSSTIDLYFKEMNLRFLIIKCTTSKRNRIANKWKSI